MKFNVLCGDTQRLTATIALSAMLVLSDQRNFELMVLGILTTRLISSMG